MQLAYLAVSEAKRVCARHVMRATARETKRRDWIYETKHFVEKLKLNSGPQTTISAQKGQLVHRRVEVSSCYWISFPHTWHVNFLFFFCWNAITASPRLPKMNERIDSWQQCLAKATFSVTLSPKKGFHVTLLSIFSPLEFSSIKIWEAIRFWNDKCSLPGAVRVSKTRVLKLLMFSKDRLQCNHYPPKKDFMSLDWTKRASTRSLQIS